MPLDSVFLKGLQAELSSCIGSRIDRVHQPQKDMVILHLRWRGGSGKLLISAGGNQSRIHFTNQTIENPATPPMFCMLLRKHLVGAKIASITQPPMERMLDFALDCTDEMGEPVRRHLMVELMGRASNLILLDGEGRITECMRRVDFEMSEKRQVLPGLFYHHPPATDRLLLTDFSQALLEKVATQTALDRWLMDTFAGLSPLVCRELAYQFSGVTDPDMLTLDKDKLTQFLTQEFTKLEQPNQPTMVLEHGTPKQFSFAPITQYGDLYQLETAPSFSQLLDSFYGVRDHSDRMRQRSLTILKTLTSARDRISKKLELQKKELEATLNRERLRQLGDIVTANIHGISRGQTKITVQDFYDENMTEIEIALSPTLSPQQNAAKFYKDYAKAKHAQQVLTRLLEEGEVEKDYLQGVLYQLGQVETDKDITDIREELEQGGYLRRQTGRKAMKQAPSRPMAFRSSNGIPIYVGRNNKQNDQLSLKSAQKNHLWFHAQKIHGSHVILESTNPADEDVTEAAQLAAYFSQAKDGQNVSVDVTPVKFLKKPANGKPGMVIYHQYRTVFVSPDEELVKKLRV